MRKALIILQRDAMEACLKLAEEFSLGFEYNDFFMPDLLDDADRLAETIYQYKQQKLPEYTTLHGAFFDVIPFSPDHRIREMSDFRIRQSIDIAKQLGVKAVIFHTNYNPFLNSESYIKSWLKNNISYWSGILETYPDMNIYLENMFDTTPDLLLALSEALCKYDNYGVCLDYAHATLSDVKPEIWAESLSSHIKHVHINDNDFISDLHLAWGDGKIDRQAFYECYNRYMQDATVLIETTPMENKIRSLEVLKKEGFL